MASKKASDKNAVRGARGEVELAPEGRRDKVSIQQSRRERSWDMVQSHCVEWDSGKLWSTVQNQMSPKVLNTCSEEILVSRFVR